MVRARLLLCLTLLVVTAGCASPTTTDPSTLSSSTPTSAASPAPETPVEATGSPVASTRPVVTATVVDVVDGDTIKVRFEDGTRDTVRLLGVDTPEVYSENAPDEFEGVPDTDAGRECLGGYGERASEFATDRLAGETVRLGFDENEGRRGYYDRLLAYVYLDGEQFNYRLVAEGYARMYDSDFVERDRYATAEQRAQEANRGLWSCATAVADGGTVTTASDGETDETADSSDAPLDVTVHADAAGPDGDNLNDEYVVLRNTGSTALDLGGWTVADAADHVYTVPDGTTVAPDESVTIHTGEGSDTAGELYWGRASPVWNNDGDTVTVRDGDGAVVTTETYG